MEVADGPAVVLKVAVPQAVSSVVPLKGALPAVEHTQRK